MRISELIGLWRSERVWHVWGWVSLPGLLKSEWGTHKAWEAPAFHSCSAPRLPASLVCDWRSFVGTVVPSVCRTKHAWFSGPPSRMCVLLVRLCCDEGLICCLATKLGNSLPIHCPEHQRLISLLTVLLLLCNSLKALICKRNAARNGSFRVFTDLIIYYGFLQTFLQPKFSDQIMCPQKVYFRAKMLP